MGIIALARVHITRSVKELDPVKLSGFHAESGEGVDKYLNIQDCLL